MIPKTSKFNLNRVLNCILSAILPQISKENELIKSEINKV